MVLLTVDMSIKLPFSAIEIHLQFWLRCDLSFLIFFVLLSLERDLAEEIKEAVVELRLCKYVTKVALNRVP